MLDSLISKNQSAFVPVHLITDNVITALEIQHLVKKRQGKEGVVGLKLDMSKAYDRVEWGYLREVMIHMGFSTMWVSLILNCISSVRYWVHSDSGIVGPFEPKMVLR